ncbi:MAG: TIGR04282 family arsenosugar biosynthesis glycosyltransferase [Verrucomicrobiales bacterium]
MVLVFLKAPVAGKVKTRLAAGIGPERATAVYRELVARTLANLPPGEPVRIQFDPPGSEAAIRGWLAPHLAATDAEFRPQSAGDLGARLEKAFDDAFADGASRVAAIGTDCPDVTPAVFGEAWRALADHDAVFGPADDGGYYLIALRKPCPTLFRGIPWSAPDTLAASLQNARASGIAAAVLDQKLCDIDDLASLEKVGIPLG